MLLFIVCVAREWHRLEFVTLCGCSRKKNTWLISPPEDKVLFDPYIIGRDKLIVEIDEVYSQTKNIESQKEFALAVKDKSYSSVLFAMRKQGVDQSIKVIEEQLPQYRERLLRNYLNSW